MYTAERQRSQPYLQRIAGPLYEQWYLLHHRVVRVITNHPVIAAHVRSYLYYAELLAEYIYEEAARLPVSIPEHVLWQVGQRAYRSVALTCYLFETGSGESFPPAVVPPRPEEISWDEIGGVTGPRRARWQTEQWRFREYQAYPGVTSRVYSLLHKEDLYGTVYIEDVSQCAPWFLMRFVFYMVLGSMFSYNGYEAVHAGAVAQDGSAVMLVGSPTSGKTTLVLACLHLGMQYLADDVLLLAEDDGLIRVYAFPEDIGVRSGTVDLLGQHEFMRGLTADEREKRYVYAQQHFREQVIDAAPIDLLLFIHVEDRAATFRAERLSPSQVVSLLLQEYISRQEAQGRSVEKIFALFNDLALQAPAYRLWLTPDTNLNALQVRALLMQANFNPFGGLR
ncbi:MAG TPA: hypothetical protein VFB60_25030 [Ktedonobacteraceae bacterium]|nr:hypothetical protein [Ktedonobacteraceae bacterium]